MADQVHDRTAIYGALALVVVASRHYGYYLAPGYHAHAWNGITAAIFLIACVWAAIALRGWVVYPLAWGAIEEAQVIACTVAYVVKPWVVQPGQDQCSALLSTDLGLYGAAVLGALALWQAMRH
jgi:hypothetical protein